MKQITCRQIATFTLSVQSNRNIGRHHDMIRCKYLDIISVKYFDKSEKLKIVPVLALKGYDVLYA